LGNPKIGIITAAYRWKSFINDYLDSIEGQRYKNLCVYICDDGSKDGSVEEFLSKLKNVKTIAYRPYIHSGELKETTYYLIELDENHRQGFARNKAVFYAMNFGCDAIAIHDVDDFWYPNFVDRHVEEWQKDPELIGLVYSDYDIWDSRTNITTAEHKESFSWENLHRHCTSSSNCLISKAAWEKCGPYSENISPVEDYLLSLQISNFFVQKHIAERLWRYQLHGENCTIRELDRHRQMHPVMVNEYNEWRKKHSL